MRLPRGIDTKSYLGADITAPSIAVTQLLTQPPPGYRARVIVLAVLWAL